VEAQIIEQRVASSGGIFAKPGCSCNDLTVIVAGLIEASHVPEPPMLEFRVRA